ncbi:MAG: HAD family hydrolase [Spirochaetia bacterium]|nr:HAD family hydrolase [Spirochaetia bacterium]
MAITAVGFDVDGTLYPELMMYLHAFPLIIRSPLLMYHYGQARKILRKRSAGGEQITGSFRTNQAAAFLESRKAGKDGNYRAAFTEELIEKTEEIIDASIYAHWNRLFADIKPFKNVRRAWLELKEAGLSLGLLSDFPIGVKPEALGIADLADAWCCSEETGYLKPRPEPFIYLAEKLGCPPENILYVGNSYEKDVVGAHAAGMKTALLTGPGMSGRGKYPLADIVFSRYASLPKLLTSYL